ncbi:unnamed protein product [Haemonchus placei]|uniref:Uncharacterized protein n=1 Tax=Haemonchus placei TaxID=6290 RepID=A0A3P7T6Z9_HAEPC|nr:unnamed protein product [Haemonchus placei]
MSAFQNPCAVAQSGQSASGSSTMNRTIAWIRLTSIHRDCRRRLGNWQR